MTKLLGFQDSWSASSSAIPSLGVACSANQVNIGSYNHGVAMTFFLSRGHLAKLDCSKMVEQLGAAKFSVWRTERIRYLPREFLINFLQGDKFVLPHRDCHTDN